MLPIGETPVKPYFYSGRYSPTLLLHVLQNSDEFASAMQTSVEAFGGRVVRCLLTAQSTDPVGFLEFPSDIEARSWNRFYAGQDGVVESRIQRLLDSGDLTQMKECISRNDVAASGHRNARKHQNQS